MTKDRNGDIISGWQAIADHLEVSVRTAQRYGHEKGMPFKQPGGQDPCLSRQKAQSTHGF